MTILKKILVLIVCLVVVGTAWLVLCSRDSKADVDRPSVSTGVAQIEAVDAVRKTPAVPARTPSVAESEVTDSADAEEKAVDAFDALTDQWMEPAKGGVKMEDVSNFVRRFKGLPKSRQEECLQRALNLIPDENIMLLAGILLDKSVDKELVELVFNDVLNRDEDVKKPILNEIFKDKTHPCWTDTAWILDVTGELPKK